MSKEEVFYAEDPVTKQVFAYSPEFRKNMRAVKFLLYIILALFLASLLILSLIYFQTGIIGRYLAYGVCS